MAYVIVFVLLVAVVIVIVSPLRRGPGPARIGKGGLAVGTEMPPASGQQRVDLEAAREAKLREIRDAELDHQTGKLSDQDFEAVDSQLRAEAIAIIAKIDELDGLGASATEGDQGPADPFDQGDIADEQSVE